MQVVLKKTKDCKSVVRFDAPPEDGGKEPLIRTVYVRRPEADKFNFVTLTVEGK